MSANEAAALTRRPASGARSSRVLAIACVGVVLATLDMFIVSVALPDIGRDLGGASLNHLSWILNGYTIVYAALLAPLGRLAERHRRDRSYLLGIAVFTAASAGCAAAADLWALVAFRVLQAAGAALMTPTSLGLVLAATEPSERGDAVRLWAAIGGFAGAFGPVVGGLLLTLSWRWIFIVNVPIGLFALVVGWAILPEVAGHDAPPPDVSGAALATAGVALLTYGLVSVGDVGWMNPIIVASLLVGVALIGAFVVHCLWARNPLVDPALFRDRNFTSSFLALAPFSIVFGAFLLSLVLWEQNVWRWSALKTGLLLAPGPLLVPTTSLLFTNRLIRLAGPSSVVALGLTIFAAACAGLALAARIEPAISTALCATVLSGVGVGLTMPTLMGAAAASLPQSSFSTGSGVLNMVRQTGMVFGVASLVAVVGSAGAAPNELADFKLAWWLMAAGAAIGLPPCLFIQTNDS